MFANLIGAALIAATVQSPAPDLSQESKALLRCSAAFAMVTHGQSIGDEAALKWPRFDARGREFFVRSLAQMMDETGLNREGIADLVGKEARRLRDAGGYAGEVGRIMPACLAMLDASGV